MSGLKTLLRRFWAWFLWSFLERAPFIRNCLLAALGRVQVIFLDYPVRPRPRYGHGQPPHPHLSALLDRGRESFREQARQFAGYAGSLKRIPRLAPAGEPTSPHWQNGWLPGLDAAAIYGLLASLRPARFLEIGSGNSTKFARRAVKDHHLATRIVSIDPHPRGEIDVLCDRVLRQPVEDVDLGIFDELEPGDILFVDNSHRSFMNSDVSVVFLDILPRLRSGVIVGFHDIFLPHDYPASWGPRYYSEQYLLATLLLADGPRYAVLFPAYYVSQDAELAQVMAPLWAEPELTGVETYGTSFWLRVA